jgi:hypothetical protein
MCYRPTTTVLATLNVTDFIYTCDRHLSDRGFATRLDEIKKDPSPAVSQADIDTVKRDWEAKQKQKEQDKKDKEKEAEKAKDGKESDKDKEKPKGDHEGERTKSPPSKSTSGTASPAAEPSPSGAIPTHTRFALHRDIFAMRLDEHRRARERKAAKELAPRLPGAPVGGL